ncbi:MAG: amidohydrolase family protein [Alistipes sp.]
MQCRKIASNYLWTPSGFRPNPLVEVDHTGRIVSVESCTEPDRIAGTEFYAGILTPGFVNAHCHLELSYLQGAIPQACGFAGFARTMGAVRDCASLSERQQAMQRADNALWQSGCVAVGDVSNGDSSFEVKAASPLFYHTFVEFFGLRSLSADSLRPLLLHPHTSLTPHSIYSVQDAPLCAICAEGSAPLSIHFMESAAEAALFDHRGDLWEWYKKVGFMCDFLHHGSPTQRIIDSVPATRSTLLVHACCCTDSDVKQLMDHFTAPLFWVLCPQSNQYISRTMPPVELLRAQGATICIGTDSLASNTNLSLLDELKTFRNIPLAELLGWATLNGARALGVEQELGSVAVGKRCGLNLLSGLDYQQMSLTAQSQVHRIL